jgi:BphX-like protein
LDDLAWWLRIVGVLYLFISFVSIGPRIPIRAEGPAGVLDRAKSGDPTARFVVDTWLMFGLYMGAVGIGLLAASRAPEQAVALAWAVIGLEAIGGIGIDVYKLARGYRRGPPLVWIVIHAVVIASGLMCLGVI